MKKSTPFRNLQRSIHAKREGRIAPYFHGRSASPMTGCTYSVRALRSVIHGKFLTGSIISSSSLQTKIIAKALAKTVLETQPTRGAKVIALAGELGSGKTTFAQGFAQGLGVKEKILSPTFILLKEFRIRHSFFRTFYHIDCYRLDNPAKELLPLGFKGIIADPRNIVVVEWADRIKKILPKDVMWIQFEHRDKNKRSIMI